MTAPVTIGPEHDGATVELPAGARLCVRLPEHPTTGVIWTLVTGEGLRVVEDRFEPLDDPAADPATLPWAGGGIGAAGHRCLVLERSEPPAAGDARPSLVLELALGQPWEGPEAVQRRFRCRFR